MAGAEVQPPSPAGAALAEVEVRLAAPAGAAEVRPPSPARPSASPARAVI